ncbi:hypothetical protein ILUMI_09172 [Ignelater luminosus]|uniref:Deltamethrin resistance protein prag01 domain-containing protein n=1 Tax=Ignelater luminosus TaxID=2038154 RepID=A0A8K0G9X4_IGNLU|nr:hypothetical protein ILUMI_09172 [Ignelater luminosus]
MNRTVSLLRTNLIAHVSKRNKAYLGELKGSMNDLPQPCGSWKTNHEAKQRKYNAQLAIGIGFLVATILFGKSSGLFFFNGEVPDAPAPKNDYSK